MHQLILLNLVLSRIIDQNNQRFMFMNALKLIVKPRISSAIQIKLIINEINKLNRFNYNYQMQSDIEFLKSNQLPQSLRQKVDPIVKQLNKPIINLKIIKQFCKDGIPDEAMRIREYCWKLLLNYLPENRSKWANTIAKNQATYQQFLRAFLPQEKYVNYPLIMDKNDPNWELYKEDFLLWEQIEKDTSRTHAQLAFFSKPAKQIMIPFLTGPRKQKFRMMSGDETEKYENFMKNKELQRVTYRYHIMTRILFVYSKLNPKLKYVQGMNQILAPIYYLVNSQKPEDQLQQASCFFMLNNAMSTIIQLHIKDLDDSETGISGKLSLINNMLISIQPQIWNRLEKLKIDPFFYCFRWMTLLYAQEFQLFDVMRLWDSIFGHDDRVEFMNYVAIAIIMIKKDIILKSEFIVVLQKLQNLKYQIEIEQVISSANELYMEYKKTDYQETSLIHKKSIEEAKKKKIVKKNKIFEK